MVGLPERAAEIGAPLHPKFCFMMPCTQQQMLMSPPGTKYLSSGCYPAVSVSQAADRNLELEVNTLKFFPQCFTRNLQPAQNLQAKHSIDVQGSGLTIIASRV